MDIQVNKSKGEVNKCYTTEIIQQEEKSNKNPVRGLHLKTSNTIFTALRTTTEARIHRIQLFPFATANFAPATAPTMLPAARIRPTGISTRPLL